jgi:hypothetical protein
MTATFTVEGKSKEVIAFMEYASKLPFVKINVSGSAKTKSKSKVEKPYNEEFVAKIEASQQEIRDGKGVEVDITNLWGKK